MALITLFFLYSSAFTQAGERLALVVGNANYQYGSLKNPINDAEDIQSALQKLNFKVTLLKDATRSQLLKAVQQFRKQLNANTEVAVFYYAVHGAQFENKSYLLPLHASIASPADLPIEALKANDLLTQMRSRGSRVNIMVLDACRDLPFPQLKRSRSRSRGLARIESSNSALVAYSTRPGGIAADGSGRNSPYTAALLKLLPQQGLTITQLFNDVGVMVNTQTGGKQTPWINSSPMPRVYLAGQQITQIPLKSESKDGENTASLSDKPAVIPSVLVEQIVDKPFTPSDPAPVQIEQIANKPQVVNKPVVPAKPDKYPFEPKMVFIQGGTFQMGCVSGQDCQDDEAVHEVNVKSFWMGQYEVTFAEWQHCVSNGGCQSNQTPSYSGWGKRPVINVSWHDANEYATWLSRKTGKDYRLPTEAEWEYAARAGSNTKYHVGNNAAKLCQYGNHADKSTDFSWSNKKCSDGIAKKTAFVGSYQANAWKLYDTIGNVWEWTCSSYQKGGLYQGLETQCTNKNDSRSRVLRGGSWFNGPRSVRSASRFRNAATTRIYNVGFRLSRTH